MENSEVHLEPVAVRRQTAARMLDCSPATVYRLEQSGKLQSILVGADRRILVASIRRLAESLANGAHPGDQEAA